MPTNLLILPFLGGFLFLNQYIYTRFIVKKLSGQRLLIQSAVVAVLLWVFARMIVLILNQIWPGIGDYWQSNIAPGSYTGTATVSFFLGLVSPSILNWFIGDKRNALNWSIERAANSLEKLLHKSLFEDLQVQLTLRDGKVYVGYIISQPDTMLGEFSYVRILPVISGHRSEETKEITFSTDYAPVYEYVWNTDNQSERLFTAKDFEKCISAKDIFTASVYDPDVYEFFTNEAAKNSEEEVSVELPWYKSFFGVGHS